jgi:hypothetical protein
LGRRINKNVGKFPSEEVAREIGVEQLFKIASQTVEFNTRLNLGILKSNHYLTQMMKQYLFECESGDRLPETDIGFMRNMIKSYEKESEEVANYLVN